MIVFSAIVPHSPLLLPTIGKEHRELLAQTSEAYHEIEQALYASRPETIVMISPHAPLYPDAFSANVSNEFTGTVKEFGDHGTAINAKADFLLTDRIHRGMREATLPFTLTSNTELDYGFTVPLVLLTSQLKQWKLIPLSISGLDAASHVRFGQELGQILQAESTRVAVIASVDLSHHANAKSPQGERPEGISFDQAAQEAITRHTRAPFDQLPPATLERAGQCAHKPLLMYLSALEPLQGTPHVHCYEAPFGVDYLTAEFRLA